MQNKKKLIVILGPTASGKTKLAIEIAKNFSTEIVSADSRQIYKDIPISTAQPSKEELASVKHHLIGNLPLTHSHNAADFAKEGITILEKIFEESDYAVLCGGTGLYIDALCYGIDAMPDVPEELIKKLNERAQSEGLEALVSELEKLDPLHHSVVDRKNAHRIIRALSVCLVANRPYSSFKTNPNIKRNFDIIKIGIEPTKETLHQNITTRIEAMFKNGLVEEAKNVYKYKNEKSTNTIGLKEIFSFIDNRKSIESAKAEVALHTKQYAKRQLTWFRRCKHTKWLKEPNLEESLKFILKK